MVKRFEASPTDFPGLMVLQRLLLQDNRGMFQRLFDLEDLQSLGWQGALMQVNHTVTKRKGSVRGMHLQLAPFAEYKLVTCLRGRVFDVVVDLRKGSSHFLKSFGVILSADQAQTLLIPPGFAHGFQTLEDEVEMLYCHSQLFHPEADHVVQALDSRLGIQWPLDVTERSERDLGAKVLDHQFEGVEV